MTEKKEADAKDTVKYVYNPVSLGILYFSFALSLWASEQINDPKINAIAIILTIISFIFFVAVFSEWVLKLFKKIFTVLAPLTFLAFVYGFVIGWLQAFSQVSGIILQVIAYFGFAWVVTILLTMVKDIPYKQPRILASIIVIIILLVVAGIRLFNQDYISGCILIAIAILITLVAVGCLKLHGGIFE